MQLGPILISDPAPGYPFLLGTMRHFATFMTLLKSSASRNGRPIADHARLLKISVSQWHVPPDELPSRMNYRATKIRLTCDERTVREWASYMLDHLDEVSVALHNEGVRHDIAASRAAAAKSELSIDVAHRRFKRHWDRKSMETLRIDPTAIPHFEGCELLFEART